jgi:beta-fructofuranosidase
MAVRRLGRGVPLRLPVACVVRLALVLPIDSLVSAGEAAHTAGCTNAQNITAPCGPGNDQCDAASPLELGLGFHIFDASCDINDPNGMFFDPSTKLYHLFYQDHLGEPPGGSGSRAWGHLVSHDLVRWARLPVALWNDQAYDNVAIYSGSATIVDGVPTQLYPGICSVNAHAPSAACASGVNLAVAVPANRSDPLLQNWSKPGYNPVAGNITAAPPASGSFSCGDPSAAWRTSAGEWRVVTRDTVNASLFGSVDFKSWYHIGRQPGLTSANPKESGACPSLFPMPPDARGAGAPAASDSSVQRGSVGGSSRATHCYMHTTHANGTVIRCGVYTDGAPTQLGQWRTTMAAQRVDTGNVGSYFAAKDMWDPSKGRRVLWGWITIPHGALTMPREITYDAELNQLIFSPLPEQASLRSGTLASCGSKPVHAQPAVPLGRWNSSQFEIEAVFDLPSSDAMFGVQLGVDVTDVTDAPIGTFFFVDFRVSGLTTIGSNSFGPTGKQPGGTQSMQIAKSDTQVRLQIFVDGDVTEYYAQGGRAVVTNTANTAGNIVASIKVLSGGSINLVHAQAWSVGSIWTSPAEVLATAGVQSLSKFSL